MKYHLQKRASSKEGWSFCETLCSKKECEDRFAALERDGLDWRVGYLLRLRSGLEYCIVVAKTGKLLKSF